MKKQTPRKKHSGRSVVWGKVILPTIFNIETQEEETNMVNCEVCNEWLHYTHFYPSQQDPDKPRRACRKCWDTKIINEDGKEVRAMGVIRYDNLVREKNLNPFAKIRND
tara:strand:+ start:1796 stop:2122 length:327 start_codon:yes stop_codon:yes gene_type:complete